MALNATSSHTAECQLRRIPLASFAPASLPGLVERYRRSSASRDRDASPSAIAELSVTLPHPHPHPHVCRSRVFLGAEQNWHFRTVPGGSLRWLPLLRGYSVSIVAALRSKVLELASRAPC